PALLWSIASRADEKSVAQARAKAVEQFVGNQFAVVAHVDITRVDLDALTSQLIDPLIKATGMEPTSEADRNRAHGLVDGLLKAGGKEAYVIATGRDIGSQPPLVV